ncbi:TonB-dependent siderophore receptor [uncultured Phascolarctobacterium sp.]|uniref:TonB-dependent receptor plug domain-containing protein n=1 Tax=uncultured Phascolarctobacterium sp. TaxID=512296 RepID=UPI002606CD83|nr:TonB-dependent receptor [uncultured Phascolarctobacterium sp.]
MQKKELQRLVLTTLLTGSVLWGGTAFAAQEALDEYSLDAVVVTATRTEMTVKEAPSAVEIVDSKKLEQTQAKTLHDALKGALGVNVFNDFQGRSNVSIRGSKSRHVLIMVDGKRLGGELSYNSANAWDVDRIRMEDVEKVEIIRGPAGALYGSDAIGGVINVITKTPEKTTASVNYEYGWYEDGKGAGYKSNLYLQGAEKQYSYKVSAGLNNSRPYQISAVDEANFYGEEQPLSLNVGYTFDNGNKLSFDFSRLKEDTHRTYLSKKKMTDTFSLTGTEAVFNKNKRTDYAVTYQGSDDINNWLFRAYKSVFDKEYAKNTKYPSMGGGSMGGGSMGGGSMGGGSMGGGSMGGGSMGGGSMGGGSTGGGMPGGSTGGMTGGGSGMGGAMASLIRPINDDVKRTLSVFEGNNSWTLSDKNKLTAGFEYRQDKSEGTRLKKANTSLSGNAYTARDRAEINYWAAYVQDELKPTEKWLIIPSVRFDHSDKFGNEVTSRIATTYNAADDVRVKAVVGQGYKTPTVNELYHFWEMYSQVGRNEGEFYVGNPDLKPEKSLSYELAIEKDWGDKTTVHFGLFRNELKDMIQEFDTGMKTTDNPTLYPGIGKDRIMTYKNIPEATMQGAELSASHKLAKDIYLNAGYTFLDAKDKTEGTRLLDTSRHQVTIGVSYQPENIYAWDVSFDLVSNFNYYYRDNERSTMKNPVYDTKNFTIANIMTSKYINKDTKIYLGIDNISNHQNFGLFADGNLGRLYRVGMEYKF